MSRFFRQAGDSDSDSESSEEEEELLSSADEAAAKPKSVATSKPMSRFLRTEGSDESDSPDDDEDDDEEEDDEAPAKEQKKPMSRFHHDAGDDEESEDEKRVVKSAKDKRLDEMEATGKVMDNALKINDWVAISNEFDKLVKLVQRETNISERVPSFFIKTLVSLDSSLNTAIAKEKDAKKKMNASNARAMNQMKQRVKKTMKEHEDQIKQYQTDPEEFDRQYAVIAEKEAVVLQPRKKAGAGEEADGPETDEFQTVGRGGKPMTFTADSVFKNLQLVNEARGKKNTDRQEQIKILERLLEVAATTYQRIRVLLTLISSRFDYNTSVSSYLPLEMWSSAQREVDLLISILTSNTAYSVQESSEDYDDMIERTPDDQNPVVRIRGSIGSYVDRLDDEFIKSLQHIDPHGTEYVDRLKDEKALYQIICRAQAFFERLALPDPLARVVMRRLEHIYSKPIAVVQALEQTSSPAIQSPSITLASTGSTSALIHALSAHLYKSGDSLLRTRAMLCHIYHYALHNEFHTARDMLLMSHLQESIHAADVGTQILYNRAIVQLGLSAFRCGMIKEAQATLQDMFTTQRVKELLAQGVHQQRYAVLTPEQEKAERQRQLPFHTHINTELLEAAFLVSCMLVEIPLLASIETEELKRKAISKPFRRLLDFADRQVFTGPPESTRDHIMQASKALQDGEWEKCRNLIQSIKIWSLMPEEKAVKEMLARRIQEEGLRTYLFTYSPYYTTLSLDMLSRTFSLPLRTVTSIVSKMIWNEELPASLEQSSGVVVFHRVELSRAQQLAQSLADKVSALVEQNEKTLDAKLGVVSGGWTDRGDREQKGDQTQERNRRGGTRGAARGGRGGARFVQGPIRQGAPRARVGA